MQHTHTRSVRSRMLGFAVAFAAALAALPALPAMKAQATGNVTLYSDGTLVLFGDVTKDQIWAYRENNAVRRVVAADDCVLPADCSELFKTSIDDFSVCYWTNLLAIDLTDADTSHVTSMADMFRCCYCLNTLDLSNFDTSNVTDMESMFYNCNNLNTLDLSSFDTSNVTDMKYMFHNCGLMQLDLSSFDTSNVTDMSYMFCLCDDLNAIDLSSFDTSNVTNMSNMFECCRRLNALDLSGFDTSKVTDMGFMFEECNDLTALDLSSFDTADVTNMKLMFRNCSSMTELDLSSFDTSNVTSMEQMFSECRSLTTIYVSGKWNTDSVSYPYGVFDSCYALIGGNGTVYNSSGTSISYARIDKPLFLGYFTLKAAAGTVTLSSDGTLTLSGAVTKEQIWAYRHNDAVNYIVAEYGCALPPDCSDLFLSYEELTNEELSDYEGEVPENPRWDGIYEVYCWTNLFGIDFTDADTSHVTSMVRMFSHCDNLRFLDLSSFDTSNVTDMSGMFRGCSNLDSLYLYNFDTSKVSDLSDMFNGCSGLSFLNLNSFDTSNVTDMSGMFRDCSNLTALDLSSFDTSKVLDMSDMFNGCSRLSFLNLNSFDTSNVTDMSGMFRDCSNLTALDLSSFDTSNVTKMRSMFTGCSGLTVLDLSSFDTSSVTDMNNMFNYCWKLTAIYVSDRWNTDSTTDSFWMFAECAELKGGNGTPYDINKTDKEYARIDRPGQLGYLTEKNNGVPKESVTSVSLSKNVFPYTGKQVKVGSYITVRSGDTKLRYGTDFTMSYADNVECGADTASVTITGIGDYTGNVMYYYTIVPVKQAAPKLSTKDGKLHVVWTADPNAQAYQVQYCQDAAFTGDTLHKATYADTRTSCDLSKYSKQGETWYVRVRATVQNSSGTNYGTWSEAKCLAIRTIDNVTLSQTEFTYTGKAVKVGSYITVKSGDTKLKYGTDFTMTYKKNVDCGVRTASVKVQGIGEYTGSITKNYTVLPEKQAEPKLSTNGGKLHVEWIADPNAQAYQVQYCQSASFSGDTLHKATYADTRTSCDLSKYSKPGETWYVRVRATVQNSSGTNYGTWSDAKSLTIGTIDNVTLSQTEFAYTGKAVKVGSYIKVRSGDTALKYDVDFTLAYENNVSKGTATVAVIGIGEYAGSSVSKEYQIK